MRRAWILLIAPVLAACSEAGAPPSEPPVRGLKTVVVEDQEKTTVRRYPSVLQPAELTTLSFQIAGRLREVELKVGQVIAAGDTVAEIDTRSLELAVESAQAALDQAEASAVNAAEDLARKQELLDKGVATKAAVDQAEATALSTAAQVEQLTKQLESSREDLSKAVLEAPFSGIVNSVEVESYANVGAGAPVVTLYSADNFEAAFSVNFDVVSRLAVGKRATVRLADNPDIVLDAHVSELGSRADTVSSFPVVVTLDGMDPSMKAGMAVEIAMEFAVPRGQGFALPLSVLPLEGQIEPPERPDDPGETHVYVYDEATSTVKKRDITIAGVRENSFIVIGGLEPGERVASAGVSFLRDGQKVKLLEDGER